MEVKLQENYLLSDFNHFEIYYINQHFEQLFPIHMVGDQSYLPRYSRLPLNRPLLTGPPWSDKRMAS